MCTEEIYKNTLALTKLVGIITQKLSEALGNHIFLTSNKICSLALITTNTYTVKSATESFLFYNENYA